MSCEPNCKHICPRCGHHSVPDMGEFTGCLHCGWSPFPIGEGRSINRGVYQGWKITYDALHRKPTACWAAVKGKRRLEAGTQEKLFDIIDLET